MLLLVTVPGSVVQGGELIQMGSISPTGVKGATDLYSECPVLLLEI